MFSPDQWAASTGVSFYNNVATQSLRFDDGSSAYLNRTPSSAGNRKTWTWSSWIKRSNLGANSIFEAGTASNNSLGLQFDSASQSLQFFVYNGSSVTVDVKTTQVFRDVSAWYHIVMGFDTTQATASNRIKLYVNGSQITDLATSTYPSQNTDYNINNTNTHQIGRSVFGGSNHFDGYMADVNFVDGSQLDPTSFGEFKNGVWIAKEYTGSYGTNGFRLQFNQTGTGTASSSTIGADTSGNDNHFTSSGIASTDCNIVDSPENNMCTFNSVGRRYGQSYVATFSEGNLKAVGGGNATHIWGSMAINQIASQGGVYFEIRIDSLDTARTYMGVIGDNGANNKNSSSNGASYTFPIKAVISRSLYGYFGTDSTSINLTTGNTTFGAGDVAGIAILSDGKFFMHRNGTYLKNASGNTGDPSTGTNEIATIDLTLGDWVAYVGYNSSFSINFGQDGSFSGNETSGGYQDANGIGDFMFAVPTNCLAICSSNMAEPTISPNETTQADDYFNTVLYTGDGTSSRAITGVGFQPDFTWIKIRNASPRNHQLFDVVRGVNKPLISNDTAAETTETDRLLSFDTDGFTVGSNGLVNNSGETTVAWNWKAGGTAVSNTDGSITSSVSANTDAGFSIVQFVGDANGSSTVGHGLSKTPNMVIVKPTSRVDGWAVYHSSLGADKLVELHSTNGEQSSSGYWGSVTSSVFGLSAGGTNNRSGATHIAYCFAEIEGYSKFGSYTGNSNADGTFVYLGFRPAWVLIRPTGVGQWLIFDSERNVYNPLGARLFAESANAESDFTYLDFTSNGFKMRYTGAFNTGDIIYIAFAETPFKYSLGR